MEIQRKLLVLVGLTMIISIVDSTLRCQTYNEENVVCEPEGTNDVVLTRGLVSDNNKTTKIILKGCHIKDLEYEVFENDFYLQYIDLSENKIKTLKLGVLDDNRLVTHLNLSHNMLTSFPLGLFDQKTNLEVLDLKANRLNTLELGIFDTLEKLVNLDLSNNALVGKNMDPYIFDHSRRIKYMDFSRNNMSESPELLLHAFQELMFLNLDRCSLNEVPTFATRPNLRSLGNLILSNNHIRKLDNARVFMNLDNLEILNLAENVIEEIAADVFTCCIKKLRTLVLRNNRIKTLPSGLFSDLKKLGNLDLSHNLIKYVPLNTMHGTGLNNLNLSYNKLTYLEANFWLELKNSGTTLYKFYFNDNPWQCACLNDVLKEMKKYNVKYNSNKLNGLNPVCVTTSEFTCKRQLNDNDFYIQLFDREIKNKQV